MQPNLCVESERVCEWAVECLPRRMTLDARENQMRRIRYTINTIARMTSSTYSQFTPSAPRAWR